MHSPEEEKGREGWRLRKTEVREECEDNRLEVKAMETSVMAGRPGPELRD